MDTSTTRRHIAVAQGHAPGDLLLTGGRVVNVFTGDVVEADVIIVDGTIAGVGPYAWEASVTSDAAGGVIAPGLIDAHIHIESTLLMPPAFARLVVPRGTTAVIADPHEIANVLGIAGIELMVQASEGLPLDCYFMAPSCVPASPFERAGAKLDARAIEKLLDHPRVLGLGEMMNFPGVLAADPDVLAKIAAARDRGAPVDGHAPGLLGEKLLAYAAAGIGSDHECTTEEEALARAALGMLVQVREGSMARNLDAMVPAIKSGRLANWCLCTDDIHPKDLLADGHLDHLLRRLVAAGVPAAEAIRHASLVPARHYGLKGRGAITVGAAADLVVFEDLEDFTTRHVIKDGRLVVEDGVLTAVPPVDEITIVNTINVPSLSEDDFALEIAGGPTPVIGIVESQIVTTREEVEVPAGPWTFDPDEDLVTIACVQRHSGERAIGLGLVRGFGFMKDGAIGSSVGHDAHNLLIAGTNAVDMLACARALAAIGGGFVLTTGGTLRSQLPLPVAGLMSTAAAEDLCRQEGLVNEAAAGLGCPLESPFGTLSFLGLTVIPTLRITDQGLFDVEAFELVSTHPVKA